jgi:hypothetical protein
MQGELCLSQDVALECHILIPLHLLDMLFTMTKLISLFMCPSLVTVGLSLSHQIGDGSLSLPQRFYDNSNPNRACGQRKMEEGRWWKEIGDAKNAASPQKERDTIKSFRAQTVVAATEGSEIAMPSWPMIEYQAETWCLLVTHSLSHVPLTLLGIASPTLGSASSISSSRA